MKFRIGVIGNSPSSGSTILADMLDSTDYSLCGPELNLFSSARIFDFPAFQVDPFEGMATSSFYRQIVRLSRGRLFSYGLNESLFLEILNHADSYSSFLTAFAEHYAILRGKKQAKVLFEKSPENINAIDQHEWTEDIVFIHIMRNPAYVFRSLLKRGYDPLSAITTWYFDELKFFKARERSNVIELKYEDLAQAPFEVVANLLRTSFDVEITPEQLQHNLGENQYRSIHRFGSKNTLLPWSVKASSNFENANAKPLEKHEVETFEQFCQIKISEAYAEMFDLPNLSFLELTESLGYPVSISDQTSNANYTKGFKELCALKYKKLREELGYSKKVKRVLMSPIDFT